ncbi:MAG: hypothetical protein FJ291_26425 [Planctomycetes bacterium]|nr:hypothetical protein [Planctomycetota bacterium]
MPARSFGYYDKWRDEVLVCPRCGWRGRFEEGSVEYYETLMDCSCPSCEESPMLAVVHYPSGEQSRAHWDHLTEAEKQSVARREKWEAELEASSLKSAEQLPDLPGRRLRMTWDFEAREGGGHQTVIKCGDRVVWREPAIYEGYRRFAEVVVILKSKYGERLLDVEPTDESGYYLYGDRLSSPGIVEAARAQLAEGRKKGASERRREE